MQVLYESLVLGLSAKCSIIPETVPNAIPYPYEAVAEGDSESPEEDEDASDSSDDRYENENNSTESVAGPLKEIMEGIGLVVENAECSIHKQAEVGEMGMRNDGKYNKLDRESGQIGYVLEPTQNMTENIAEKIALDCSQILHSWNERRRFALQGIDVVGESLDGLCPAYVIV